MPLTDIKCKNAKPIDKTQRLFDGGGLYLEVTKTGNKYWYLKYRYAKKENRLSFGVYPDVTLKEARQKRYDAKKLLADDVNPAQARKDAKLEKYLKNETAFNMVAREWHDTKKEEWSEKHAKTVLKRLEADIFPILGNVPINEIGAPQLLAVLKKIEARGALDIAKRARQTCGQIFRFAVATGRATHDISFALKDTLKSAKKSHYASLNENELPEFLSQLKTCNGHLQTQLAIKFTILTFTRTGEVRGALWEEIDLDKKEWRIPLERMKMNQLHIVPLADQVIELLDQLKKLTGNNKYIFPSQSSSVKPMSENTMLFAVYRMGYHSRTTIHGFRSTASTILNEQGFRPDVIERQLAHGEQNAIRAAYNHAQYMPERRQMMQHWADYIDRASDSHGNLVKFKVGGSK